MHHVNNNISNDTNLSHNQLYVILYNDSRVFIHFIYYLLAASAAFFKLGIEVGQVSGVQAPFGPKSAALLA